jgi:glycosyltransferase involved in cell wall biosynthesis
MPRQGFLFVVGAYGRQVRPRLANVQVIPPVAWDRMREAVYARTRVLLMPSEYESYGRCGVEAAHAGVPTIAHPTGVTPGVALITVEVFRAGDLLSLVARLVIDTRPPAVPVEIRAGLPRRIRRAP